MEAVEKETCDQSHSKLWYRYRAGRATASKMKAVASYVGLTLTCHRKFLSSPSAILRHSILLLLQQAGGVNMSNLPVIPTRS